jgi:Holliday junction resolvasome RuvABC endonuclease subunit
MTAVVGIDPSLTATGLAWADGTTSTVKYLPGITGDQRLMVIADAVEEVTTIPMIGHAVDLAILEDLPTHAHGAGITGMVQGVVRHQLQRDDVPYITVPAATLKKYATGKGNATKPDMRMELYKRTGLDLKDDNQVDAWWLRALGYELLGKPIITMPKTNTDALGKLTLPAVVAA